MTPMRIAKTLIVSGILVVLIALSADRLGIGASPGIGLKQILLAVLGIVIAAVGISKLRGRS